MRGVTSGFRLIGRIRKYLYPLPYGVCIGGWGSGVWADEDGCGSDIVCPGIDGETKEMKGLKCFVCEGECHPPSMWKIEPLKPATGGIAH